MEGMDSESKNTVYWKKGDADTIRTSDDRLVHVGDRKLEA